MRIDSSGNVGIGTNSPGYVLEVYGATNASQGWNAGGTVTGFAQANTSNADFRIGTITNHALGFYTNSIERARITSGGDFVVGKTATSVATQGFGVYSTGDFEANAGNNPAGYLNRTNDGTILSIRRSNTTVGTISVTTTATAYNTSSDYRLKENIQPMTGALAKVAQLKPCTYVWKEEQKPSQGFIAHELQEVVPECVVGKKDGVDKYGNPVYQGVDTSFLVATLTAAIQELNAKVDAQTTRIETLEAEVAALKGQ